MTGNGIQRELKYITIYMVTNVRIEGFAHVPEGTRESDFFDSKNRNVIALTNAKIFRDGECSEVDTVVVNKEHIAFFYPANK